MFRANPHRYVTPAQRVRLRHVIEGVERETGVEIAAVITPHVDDVEAFARAYFDHMGIGKKGHDNGILILVVVDRRAVRIEVGRGLAALVPPRAAERVITDVIAPQCGLGRYGEGLLRGVEAVGHLIRAAHVPGDGAQ